MEPDNPTPVVEVVAFGHNRGAALETFVKDLHRYLDDHLPAVWLLTIVDNGSSDDSWAAATGLAATLPNTRAARLEERLGRKELRFRWKDSRALVAAFIEIRPSPDFDRTLAPLIDDAKGKSQPVVDVGPALHQTAGAVGDRHRRPGGLPRRVCRQRNVEHRRRILNNEHGRYHRHYRYVQFRCHHRDNRSCHHRLRAGS